MVKFKITPERFATVCNIIEYLNAQNREQNTIIRIAPRFVVGEDGEYIVTANLDDDGDIASYDNLPAAFEKMAGITPKRLEKLIVEFAEAANAIVNPQSERG